METDHTNRINLELTHRNWSDGHSTHLDTKPYESAQETRIPREVFQEYIPDHH